MRETFRVGDRIRATRTLHIMPTGTVIQDRSSNWTKLANGNWNNQGGGQWSANDFSMNGGISIRSFPSNEQTFDVPAETIERVKWRFRTGALSAAESHGVSVTTVENSLHQMGAGRDDLSVTLGRGVKVGNAHDRDSLPEGSIIYSGTPDVPASFAVFAKKNRQWVHILGERTYLDAETVIESVGGNRERPAWLDREGTEEDAEAIRQFKAVAWRVGYELKRANGWCGTYEDIVHRLGVTQADTRVAAAGGLTEGMRVLGEQAMSLPLGSLLWWQHSQSPDTWALYRRDNASTNRAGTVKVVGSDPDDHENYKRYMNVAGVADETGNVLWLVPTTPPVFAALPPGTVCTYQGGGEQEYMKQRDGNMRDLGRLSRERPGATGRYQVHQFGENPQWRVRRFN